ncbi:hypothetical protein Tco_0284342, partial [Tanacetum coccineum]
CRNSMDSGCSKHIKENLEEVVDDDDDMIDNVDHDDQPLIGKKKSGSSETRNEKMQTPIPIPPKSLRVNLSSNKEPLLEFTDSHVTTSITPRVLGHCMTFCNSQFIFKVLRVYS